jgi:hypothetical protein
VVYARGRNTGDLGRRTVHSVSAGSPEGEWNRRLEATDGRTRPATRVSELLVTSVGRDSEPGRSSAPSVVSPEGERTRGRLRGELYSDGAEASELYALVSPGRSRSDAQGGSSPSGPSWQPFRRGGWVGQADGSEGRLAGLTAEAGNRRKTHSGSYDDASHGVRFLSAKSARVIVVSVCLSDTIRPQGFSPSRRFDPTRALWLCFAPLPPIGFKPSERSPLSQPSRLSACDALWPLD